MSAASITYKLGRQGAGHRRVLIAALLVILPDLSAISQQSSAWPSGSAGDAGEIWGAKRHDAELYLNQAYDKLVALLSAKHADRDGRDESMEHVDERSLRAFKDEQSAWFRYLAAKCELEGTLTGGASPWQSAYAVKCEADGMEKRTRYMGFAISCIEHIVGDGWYAEAMACRALLYTLESRLPID